MAGNAEPTTGRVLITGAAGNLGGLLSRHLANEGFRLRLMVHRNPIPNDLCSFPTVETVNADLGDPATLADALAGADVVVHFAGVLFAPRPERFLPTTNTEWFRNLVAAALTAGVSKVVLISFPHVEGESFRESPATGQLTALPNSVHARTRLEEEKHLLSSTEGTSTTPVILRLGMVYGRGVLMVDAARWLSERRLLGVWREKTWIHLVSIQDFLISTQAAIANPTSRDIYHIGDDSPVTLQNFLDKACEHWGTRRPWRLPLWLIYTAAFLCEAFASFAGTPAPLTRDFITIGRQSYFGDTTRMKQDLLPDLAHPDLDSGFRTL